MNLVQALQQGNKVRRPILKHTGSCKSGWLDRDYVIDLLTSITGWRVHQKEGQALINSVDLLAEDWTYENT